MRNSNRAPAISFGCAFVAALLSAAAPAAWAEAPAKTTAAAERHRLLAELPKLEALSGTLGKDARSSSSKARPVNSRANNK